MCYFVWFGALDLCLALVTFDRGYLSIKASPKKRRGGKRKEGGCLCCVLAQAPYMDEGEASSNWITGR